MRRKMTSLLLCLAMVLSMLPMLGGVSYAAAAGPLAPVNVEWDNGVARWTNPNAAGVVQFGFVYLYNTKDTSKETISIATGATLTSYDFSSKMVPGDTYYFEVYFRDSNSVYSEHTASRYYTAPGTYEPQTVSNLQFGRDGVLSWDSYGGFITSYKSVLYEKNGTEWIEKAVADNLGNLSYSWAYKLEAGKTYKATLAGMHGNIQITLLTESNELTKNVVVPLDTPTGLTMDRGICSWNQLDHTNKYDLCVYSESGSTVAPTSGTMSTLPDGTAYWDASNWLTAGEKYYFTVRGRGDDIDYSHGEYATSGLFEYTGPKTNISTISFSRPTTALEYTGAAIKPAVTASGLTEGTDFVVEYSDNVNVGTAKYKISGIGDYKGVLYYNFTIRTLNLENAAVTFDADEYEYTGEEIEPSVTVTTSAGIALEQGADYTVEYSDNVSLGKGKAAVTAIAGGNCTGSKTVEFDIVPKNITGAFDITLAQTKCKYTGEAIEPAVTVEGLNEGEDYTVSYANNTECGVATVSVTGTGNYTGTVEKTFLIYKPGWQQVDGIWYYFNADGTVVTNKWMKDSKGWCWLQDDGAMLTNGWAKDTKGWCWIGDNGYMVEQTKWIKVGGDWYHITKGYRDQSKWMKDSKGWCWLQAEGAMLTNGWAKDSKGWCWMGADGYWVSNKWVKDAGEWYYIKSNHYMACNEWAKDSGGWMWMNASGKITKSKWVKDGSYWYYLKANGYMATGTQTIDGKTYKFDSSGRWIR